MKFTLGQAEPDKRAFIELLYRTGGGAWTIFSQGLFYTGSGDYQLNFTLPAGADELRVGFLRNSTGSSYDGLGVPYTIDNFSVTRITPQEQLVVMVCDPPPGGDTTALYRFGFNGQERSDEIKGFGNSYTAQFWEYDPRIGRRWNLDPKPVVGISQYAAFNNNPILLSDILGDSSEPSKRPSWGQKGPIDLAKYKAGSLSYKGNILNKTGAAAHNLILAPLGNLAVDVIDGVSNPGWTLYNIGEGIGNGFTSLGRWFSNNPDVIQGVSNELGQASRYAKENWNNPDFHLNVATMGWGVFGGSLGGNSINVTKNFTLKVTRTTETTAGAVEGGSNAITHFYPHNMGALGGWKSEFLMPGMEIDRFGSEWGKFFSPRTTPFDMRALPPGNNGAYNAFRVMKPFEVKSSLIAPAFGKIGLGTQYLSPVNMKTLLKRGIIEPIK